MQKSILISGGAQGADQLFEKCAKNVGHTCIIYTSGDVKNKEQYDIFLNYINSYLKRKYPSKNEYINGLLRRDVLVGLEAEVIYAVGTLDDNLKINGGTAWASYTFINKYKFGVIPFYLFEQNKNTWYQVQLKNGQIHFNPIEHILRIPQNIKYAGIGTRHINENGIKAIQQLYQK